jgi:hypothetical protein
MANFDTATVKSNLTSWTTTQIRSFANDCGSNFLTAFTSRWTCATKQQQGLSDTRSSVQNQLVLALNNFADEVDNGGSRDVSGLSITNTSGIGAYGGVKWTVHFDVDVTFQGGTLEIYVASIWFTFDTHS